MKKQEQNYEQLKQISQKLKKEGRMPQKEQLLLSLAKAAKSLAQK